MLLNLPVGLSWCPLEQCHVRFSFLKQSELPKKYVLEEADKQVRDLEAGPRKWSTNTNFNLDFKNSLNISGRSWNQRMFAIPFPGQ